MDMAMLMGMHHPLLHRQIDNLICVVLIVTIATIIGEEIMVEGTGIIFGRTAFPGKIVVVEVEVEVEVAEI